MTRAVHRLALGELGEALRYNPASSQVPVFGLAVLARALQGPSDRAMDRGAGAVALSADAVGGAVLLVLTVHQQLSAELIR